jgi:hypothetical protein
MMIRGRDNVLIVFQSQDDIENRITELSQCDSCEIQNNDEKSCYLDLEKNLNVHFGHEGISHNYPHHIF